MLQLKLTLLLLALGATWALPASGPGLSTDNLVHYDGYKVVRAVPTSSAQYQALQDLASSGTFDFWQDPRPGSFADIMASPSTYSSLLSSLQAASIPSHLMIPNVEALLQQERALQSLRNASMDWESYHTWEEVNAWLASLVSSSPPPRGNVSITSESYGTSYEGRPLHVYKIASSIPSNSSKPAFWIDATIHAREHITTAVITYVIDQLVNNASAYQDLLQNVDFYFAPFINPDGYVFTWTTDRLFRRTRTNWTNSTCVGVDANRNFGFQFGGPGSSSSPCSETYRGPAAYSEPETGAMKDWILEKARAKGQNETGVRWEAFITLHSYSQLWMTPYGYTEVPPQDYEELKRAGDEAAASLKGHFGTEYEVGNAGAILYLSSGSSRDWAKGEGGFKWVYTIELRDTGRYGFLLPPDQILDTSIETWSGIQVVARRLFQ